MGQLSETSRLALQGFGKALQAVERLLRFVRDLFLVKCPLYLQDVVTFLGAMKDIAGYVPSPIYKTLLFIALFSIISRKLKRWRKRRLEYLGSPSKASANLQNLPSEYVVKEQGGKSVVGNAKTQIDSFDLQVMNIKQSQGKDFRDIVFFDLMRSYKQIEQESESSI